jgi:hypothetical protein
MFILHGHHAVHVSPHLRGHPVRSQKSRRFPRVCSSRIRLPWTETRSTDEKSAFERHYLGGPESGFASAAVRRMMRLGVGAKPEQLTLPLPAERHSRFAEQLSRAEHRGLPAIKNGSDDVGRQILQPGKPKEMGTPGRGDGSIAAEFAVRSLRFSDEPDEPDVQVRWRTTILRWVSQPKLLTFFAHELDGNVDDDARCVAVNGFRCAEQLRCEVVRTQADGQPILSDRNVCIDLH